MSTGMNDEPPVINTRRVLLTLDANRFSLTTVDLAVSLAASVQLRLHGLFIEDENLLRAAELPCSREIGLMTAQERNSDLDRMQRSLRSMASQFRQHLEQSALASHISWSFESIRGRADDIGLHNELDVIYTIVGQLSARKPTSSVQRQPNILLLQDHSPNVWLALDTLLKRYDDEKAEITLVTHSDQVNDAFDQQLQQLAQTKGVSLRQLELNQLKAMLIAGDRRFDFAILPRLMDDNERRQILKYLQCPVILVS